MYLLLQLKMLDSMLKEISQRLRSSIARLVLASVLLVCALGVTPNAYSVDLPESTSKLMYARQIDSEYIAPLNLKSMQGKMVLQTLLGEGFSCRLELGDGFNSDNISCFKRPSGFAPLCDELITSVYFVDFGERVPGVESRLDLYRKLDSLKVFAVGSFCPYPRQVSADFLVARESGEKLLRHKLDDLKIIGGAQQAFDALLKDGFYCGFASEAKEGAKLATAKIACNKLPSRIQGCFNARVTLQVIWPVGTNSFKQLYSALPAASVTSLSSGCEIPEIKKGELL
jgi:hypothetical protein